MTDIKTPEWVKEEALKVLDTYLREPISPDQAISQALLSAYERGRAEREWQPIETAPKDEAVLVCGGDVLYPCTASWSGMPEEEWTLDAQAMCHDGIGRPTHWMPLPALQPRRTPMSDEAPEWVEGEDLRVDVETLARTIVLSCQYAWPKDREESVEKATRLINSFLDGHPAYERGRKEGIEEAAAWHDEQARQHRNTAWGYEEKRYEWGGPVTDMEASAKLSAQGHTAAATAIRQLLEVKG